MADDGHVFGAVAFADAGEVVLKGYVQHPMQGMASRPKESHLRPLSERNRILSHHSAPIRQTHLSYDVTSVRTDVDRFW